MNLSFLSHLLFRALFLFLLILADFLTGITKAIMTASFDWKKLANILKNNALYLVGWFCLDFLTLLAGMIGLSQLANLIAGYGATTIYATYLLRSILENASIIAINLGWVGKKGAG